MTNNTSARAVGTFIHVNLSNLLHKRNLLTEKKLSRYDEKRYYRDGKELRDFFRREGSKKENLARGVIHWRKICARRGRATDLFIGPTGDAAAKTRQ